MVTNPKVVLIIVIGLLFYGFSGLCAVVYLIVSKADAALIGLVATSTMGAIGNVSGMLSNTRTQASPTNNLDITKPIPAKIVEQPVKVES